MPRADAAASSRAIQSGGACNSILPPVSGSALAGGSGGLLGFFFATRRSVKVPVSMCCDSVEGEVYRTTRPKYIR